MNEGTVFAIVALWIGVIIHAIIYMQTWLKNRRDNQPKQSTEPEPTSNDTDFYRYGPVKKPHQD